MNQTSDEESIDAGQKYFGVYNSDSEDDTEDFSEEEKEEDSDNLQETKADEPELEPEEDDYRLAPELEPEEDDEPELEPEEDDYRLAPELEPEEDDYRLAPELEPEEDEHTIIWRKGSAHFRYFLEFLTNFFISYGDSHPRKGHHPAYRKTRNPAEAAKLLLSQSSLRTIHKSLLTIYGTSPFNDLLWIVKPGDDAIFC